MERLGEALAADNSQAALDAVRSLIDRAVLTPLPEGKGFEIELIGELAAMVALGLPAAPLSDPELFARSIEVVAGTRNRLDLLLSG